VTADTCGNRSFSNHAVGVDDPSLGQLRLELFGIDAFLQCTEGKEYRSVDVAGIPLIVLTHVDEHGLLFGQVFMNFRKRLLRQFCPSNASRQRKGGRNGASEFVYEFSHGA
jgi:hypothetical protein